MDSKMKEYVVMFVIVILAVIIADMVESKLPF